MHYFGIPMVYGWLVSLIGGLLFLFAVDLEDGPGDLGTEADFDLSERLRAGIGPKPRRAVHPAPLCRGDSKDHAAGECLGVGVDIGGGSGQSDMYSRCS